MSLKISIVINADTRVDNEFVNEMGKGCSNEDFLIEGIEQKKKFFDGFETETIVYIDKHLSLSDNAKEFLLANADTLIIRNHTNEPSFNCWNYIRALSMASGDIVCHFDQDTSAYTRDKESVQELINHLDNWQYVSYPSHWSPNSVVDPTFNYRWVSTRFFICKRQILNFPEIIKCLNDYEYFCKTYNPSRVCHWLEHFLGLIANSSVYYPPIELDKLAIWSWGKYQKYLLKRLNNQSYEEVKNFVLSRGIQYPNDLYA